MKSKMFGLSIFTLIAFLFWALFELMYWFLAMLIGFVKHAT